VHAKEVLVEKLALKNTTYRTAIQKLEAQLAHKEEMGEVRGAATASWLLTWFAELVCSIQKLRAQPAHKEETGEVGSLSIVCH
jgi:hypothetical protein